MLIQNFSSLSLALSILRDLFLPTSPVFSSCLLSFRELGKQTLVCRFGFKMSTSRNFHKDVMSRLQAVDPMMSEDMIGLEETEAVDAQASNLQLGDVSNERAVHLAFPNSFGDLCDDSDL
eukprot:scpid10152/ scgid26830/ 